MLKAEADSLLSETHLLPFLSKLGTPFIHGSYLLNCMVYREIDINVGVSTVDLDTAFSIGRTLADCLAPFEMLFFNNNTHPKPYGLRDTCVWLPLLSFHKHIWKLDVALVSMELLCSTKKHNNKIKSNLGEQGRLKAIEVKSKLIDHAQYRTEAWTVNPNSISGYSIYQSIISYPEDTVNQHVKRVMRSGKNGAIE